jgi:hypothetical protein
MRQFDVAITIGSHHLAGAGVGPGMSSAAIAYAVRSAVERLPEFCWVAVQLQDHEPGHPDWLKIYPRDGKSLREAVQWQQTRLLIEEAVTKGLVGLRAEFSAAAGSGSDESHLRENEARNLVWWNDPSSIDRQMGHRKNGYRAVAVTTAAAARHCNTSESMH